LACDDSGHLKIKDKRDYGNDAHGILRFREAQAGGSAA